MADDAITRQLQRRAPSDGFRRAGSGASVTFDHDAWGGLARVPSITRTGSGGSKSSAKAKFQRAASTFARVSSKGSGVAAGGTGIILFRVLRRQPVAPPLLTCKAVCGSGLGKAEGRGGACIGLRSRRTGRLLAVALGLPAGQFPCAPLHSTLATAVSCMVPFQWTRQTV